MKSLRKQPPDVADFATQHVVVLPAKKCQYHLAIRHKLLVTQLEKQGEILLELPLVQLHHQWRCGLPDIHVAFVYNGPSGELLRYLLDTHIYTHIISVYSN